MAGSGELRIAERVSQDDFEERLRGFHGTTLVIEDARLLTSVEPLRALPGLETLMVNKAFAIGDLNPLSGLVSVRHLRYGNTDLGNDRSVPIPDLRWVVTLQSLEKLELIGVRLVDRDLSPVLKLPNLRELSLPLRRAYRRAVYDYAGGNAAFRDLADRYRGLDDYKKSMGLV